ncbi:MAG TPA: sensor domain-containing diguanylate cyclase [Candidatus Udaeobacter sp.]|nr:sensor domain-containing diguanylate cyclase [Candidatus Udaeobacter sp.]
MPHDERELVVGDPRSRASYERRIRIASEAASWGIGAALLGTAALPTTDQASRIGLVASSLLLFLFATLWFHVFPESWLGKSRFAVGAAITQVIAAILLVLTGGIDSRYFPYYVLPILATVFGMRISGTLFTGTIAIVAYLATLVAEVFFGGERGQIDVGVIRLFALLSVIAMTALISRTIQETRFTLRQRTEELATQNAELSVARNTALGLARVGELHELVRVVYESAKNSLAIDRLYLFARKPDFADGYTVGPDGAIQEFHADPSLPEDTPRRRAVREKRTVAVNDARDDKISDQTREHLHFAAGLFVPLIHRSEVIGLMAVSSHEKREWTAHEIRVAEVIADASAAAVASFLAFEEVRGQRDRLEARMKVLESMDNLVDALALTTDEASLAQTAARSLQQGFHLPSATVLFTDPSVAILEPVGTAGRATPHPVVNGPTSCPAIRSGRFFEVTSADDPVVCPYMPFRSHYSCVPLVAGGDTVGALFLEPDKDSIIDVTVLRAAADRVALSLATRRVLETAQRQATTDGLTGLHNRHFLAEQLRLMHSLAVRHGQPYSVVAIDVDGLKNVNDTFGHEQGDLALRGLANTMRKTLRSSDVGVRTGGDEFLVLMAQSGLEESRIAAERVREAVELQGRADPKIAITVSAGVAAWRPGRSSEQVMEAADAMLYAAKRAGKDRVLAETRLEAVGDGEGAA